MTDLNPLTQSGPDETAVGALIRFRKFLAHFQSSIDDEDWKSHYELEIGLPIAAATSQKSSPFMKPRASEYLPV